LIGLNFGKSSNISLHSQNIVIKGAAMWSNYKGYGSSIWGKSLWIMCGAIGNIFILGADHSELEELGVENIDENTFRTGCEHIENLMRTLVLVVLVVMGTLGTPKSKKSKPPSLKRKSKQPRPLEASYLISLGARKLCFITHFCG
jgi:hypothetical protein